jgi:LacI family transcriptional regulator
MKKISLKDIARMAGVSTSTVSFVLNGKAVQMRISKPIADKVSEIAKKVGYQPNQVAVSLRTGQSKIIGLLVDDISNHFFAALARFIEDEANAYGYKVVFCSTENDSQKARALLNMMTYQQVDGFIITPTDKIGKDIQQLMHYRKPFVLMDRFFPDIETPYVMVDSFSGVEKGMKHLINKGHKRIGFVTVKFNMIQMQLREQGYIETLKREQGSLKNKLILELDLDCNHTREESVKKVMKFIRDTSLDAVFFATNYLGIIGLESIQRMGLQIPSDIAVVCFDDNDSFRLHTPPITVIRQPVEKIAQSAVVILMDQLKAQKKKEEPVQVKIEPELVLRK